MRALMLLFAVCLACGSTAASDDPTLTDTDGDGVPDASQVEGPDGVTCPNPIRPAQARQCEGERPVCCLGGPLGVTPRCEATLQACGQDSRLACDGANDCGAGQACCVAQQGGGQQTTIVGQCKNACSLLETQSCNGPGTCKGAKICCQLEGDVWGECRTDCEGYGETGG